MASQVRAPAASRLSTGVNLRPILRRAALAAAGTGAAAALALGPSAPSPAAAIPSPPTKACAADPDAAQPERADHLLCSVTGPEVAQNTPFGSGPAGCPTDRAARRTAALRA
jgi:hypothetical protein